MYEYLTTDEDLERRMIRGRVLSTLEFTKIRDKVCAKARTAYGRKLCEEMVPCTDYRYVEENLAWTGEAMAHIMRFGSLPLGGFRDLNEAISYAEAGGTLSCAQLLSVASFLRSADDIRNALDKARSAGSPFVDETEPHIVKAIAETGTDDRLLKLGGQSSGKPTIITAGILDQTNDIRIMGSDGQRAPIPSLLHIFTGCIDKITHVLHGLGLIVFNLFMDQPLDQCSLTCSGRSDQHNTHVQNSGSNQVFVMETASKPSLF